MARHDWTEDPFTQVHAALWDALEDNEDFAATVKAGNRIKYNSTVEHPRKSEVMIADMPEVTIIPLGGLNRIQLSSDHIQITRRYNIMMQSGSQRANLQLYPLEWLVLKILYAQSDSLGLSFVRAFRLQDSELELTAEESSRGKPRWSSALTVAVDMTIPKEDLAL